LSIFYFFKDETEAGAGYTERPRRAEVGGEPGLLLEELLAEVLDFF
jgi:hypothetical protein